MRDRGPCAGLRLVRDDDGRAGEAPGRGPHEAVLLHPVPDGGTPSHGLAGPLSGPSRPSGRTQAPSRRRPPHDPPRAERQDRPAPPLTCGGRKIRQVPRRAPPAPSAGPLRGPPPSPLAGLLPDRVRWPAALPRRGPAAPGTNLTPGGTPPRTPQPAADPDSLASFLGLVLSAVALDRADPLGAPDQPCCGRVRSSRSGQPNPHQGGPNDLGLSRERGPMSLRAVGSTAATYEPGGYALSAYGGPRPNSPTAADDEPGVNR
jgi:hypothetical protein